MYAQTCKTVAMGMIYGPLYPPAYLITCFALAVSYWGTRMGIKHWYHRPPLVDSDMLDRMIEILFYIQGLGMAMSAIVANSSAGDWTTVAGPLVASPVLFGVYLCLPLSMLKCLQAHEQITDPSLEDGDGDTMGIPFAKVREKKKQLLIKYQCPLLHPGENAWDGVEKMADNKSRLIINESQSTSNMKEASAV